MSILMGIFYFLAFLAVYVQIFFLVTFIENRKKIKIRTGKINLENYPTVTIIVPCYNEEATVGGTLLSLLVLDYPKDKLSIVVVDDGSKDNTWKVLQDYTIYPNISIYKKENGGKHTALNYGLEKTNTEFVGCLDADSSVHPEALKRIISVFNNEEVMAVAPSIVVRDPKNLLQYAQHAEYDLAHYNKKMLAFINGIHVTPGPFSIFRMKVFEIMGNYTKAHQTEDQEIALRMHRYGLKIDHCPDAYVYTNSPNTIGKLYRQRVRWIYGFIKNAIDYRDMFFKKKYGSIGMFTLPSGFISITGTIFILLFTGINIFNYVSKKILEFKTVGITTPKHFFTLDLFFINTQSFIFVSVILYILIFVALVNGRRMIAHKKILSWDMLVFIIIYTVLAPFWLLKSVWNVITSHEASWTAERDIQISK